MSRLRDEIARCYALGWSFVLLDGADGKIPAFKGWTTDPRLSLEQCLRWVEAGKNVGLRTGAVSDVVVIDKDSGAAPLDLPRTITAKTGRDGRHFYFKIPLDADGQPIKIGNSVGKIAPKTDIRGDGGQVVFPGSVNPATGGEYGWMPGLGPDEIEMAELPLELLERDWKVDTAVKLSGEGKTHREIAEQIGCHASMIAKLIDRSLIGARLTVGADKHGRRLPVDSDENGRRLPVGAENSVGADSPSSQNSVGAYQNPERLPVDKNAPTGKRLPVGAARQLPPHPNSQKANKSDVSPYLKAALDNEVTNVANAPQGERNKILNDAAFNLGMLVSGAGLDRSMVETALVAGAEACGLHVDPNCGPDGIRKTIRSGIDAGILKPRRVDPPKRQAAPPPPLSAGALPPHPAADTDYVLVPGLQVTDDGSEEVGTHHFADNCLARLPDDALYRMDWMPGQIVGKSSELRFKPLDNPEARLLIDGRMRLGKWVEAKEKDEEGNKRRFILFLPCSQDCAGLFLSRAGTSERVRKLQHIVNYPIYRTDWTLAQPGWADEIYYDQPAELAGIEPIKDVETIQGTLHDLLIDFPFKSEADRQNYIGLLLTPLIRSAIAGNIPLHLILSPRPRSGKGKLAEQVLGIIITGKPTLTAPLPKTEEEQEKRIATKLMDGDTLAHLDNINHFLDSAVLASLLTARVFACRVLGASKQLKLPNNLTLVATGNNVRATEEMVKRIIPVCLQPLEENPEERDNFYHPNLPKYLCENRPKVLACLLGMVQIWLDAGKPEYGRPLGGFEEWSSALGGIMTCSGFNEWRSNEKQWRRDADTRGEDLREFVSAWWAKWQAHPIDTQWLLELAKELDVFPDVLSQKDGRGQMVALARRILIANTDVNAGGRFIRRKGSASNSQYYLEEAMRQTGAGAGGTGGA